MSSKKYQIPTIRFEGFTDTWEQRKLSEVADFIDGNYGEKYPKNEEFVDSGVPFFTSAVIGTSGIFEKSNVKFISNEKNSTLIKAQSKGGDLILTNRGASMGTIAQIPMEYGLVNIGPQLTRINGNENSNNLFLLSLFKAPQYKRKLLSMNAGSAMNFVGLESLGKFKFIIPKMKEQLQIGTFFKQLDDTIALHQRQLDNYKELKKAMLQKIFNQELRFKNDDGNDFPEWSEVTLEEICLYKSSNISLDSYKGYTGEKKYSLYDANSIVLNIDKYDQKKDYISIIKDGAGVGRIRYCEGKSSILGTMGYLLPKDIVDIYFLYFKLQTINFSSYVSGSTIPHIYFKDYKKENVGLPCEDEQKKIANFLNKVDNHVNQTLIKIEVLKEQKKGLMQQMFV